MGHSTYFKPSLLLFVTLTISAQLFAQTVSSDSSNMEMVRLQKAVAQLQQQLAQLQATKNLPADFESAESDESASLTNFAHQSQLNISGFVSAAYQQQISGGTQRGNITNRAEVSLAKSLPQSTNLELVLAYGNDEFSIGSATVAHQWIQNLQTTVGQLDVPFGLDVEYYSPVDRRSITQPSVIEHTHHARVKWNSGEMKA